MTDDAGGVHSEMRYYPYAGRAASPKTRWESGTLPTDRRYTGQRSELSVGLIDFRARYYDPALGRFLQADTIVPGASPQALNRYTYVYNSPLGFVDPDGHNPIVIGVIALLVAVAVGLPGSTPRQVSPANAAVADAAMSVACEPYDWALTFLRWSKGDFQWLDLLGLAPVLSVGIVRGVGLLDDAADLLSSSRRLSKMDLGSDEAVELAREIAEGYTHSDDVSRVVLGKWVEGAGYVKWAEENGGIYYETAPEFWEAIGASDDVAWAVNEQFLRNQLASGVDEFYVHGVSSVDDVLAGPSSFLRREIEFLMRQGGDYGYGLVEGTDGVRWVRGAD